MVKDSLIQNTKILELFEKIRSLCCLHLKTNSSVVEYLLADELILDMRRELRAPQSIELDNFSAKKLLHILSLFDPYGIWRLNVTSGLVYWTDDVFKIHDMEIASGPVDLKTALGKYHPEDKKIVTQLIEEAVEQKTGFCFVLRLKRKRGGYKLVKSTGKYLTTTDGSEEIVGTFSQFQAAKRSIGSVE